MKPPGPEPPPVLEPSVRRVRVKPTCCSQLRTAFLVFAPVLGLGALLTHFVPVSCYLPRPWCKISSMMGWTYFSAWTLSFYPQVFTNWRRKSVVGVSFDFLGLNLLGFVCYAAFNCALYFSPHVRAEYQERTQCGTAAPVELNDVFFSLHAAAISAFTAAQCLWSDRGSQRVSAGAATAIGGTAAALGAYAGWVGWYGEGGPAFTWLDIAYACSFVKMGVNLVKYVPQVMLNHRRRSTAGWNIWNVLLDATGGTLSLGQQAIIATITNDWSAVWGNPVKTGLALVSLAFDAIFTLQHFVLYRRRHHGPHGPHPQAAHGSAPPSAGVTPRHGEVTVAQPPLTQPLLLQVRLGEYQLSSSGGGAGSVASSEDVFYSETEDEEEEELCAIACMCRDPCAPGWNAAAAHALAMQHSAQRHSGSGNLSARPSGSGGGGGGLFGRFSASGAMSTSRLSGTTSGISSWPGGGDSGSLV